MTAKDVILAIIGKIGTDGATGCVIEYAGSAIRSLSMESRMTICNMSIEAGARAGMIAPDETTFAYLKGRRLGPAGAEWGKAVAEWSKLPTDAGAKFDRELTIDAATLDAVRKLGNEPGHGGAGHGYGAQPSRSRDGDRAQGFRRASNTWGCAAPWP